MDSNNSQDIIDVRELIIKYARKWYWFVLSIIVCIGLAFLYIYSTTPKFTVSSSIMIRLSNEGATASSLGVPAELAGMVGLGSIEQVADQLEIINSRTVMDGVIRDLGVQTTYRKKVGLRWFEQYPGRSLTVVYPILFTDTMRRGVNIELEKRKKDYVVKVKYGERFLKSKHKVASLSEPIETCIGTLSFIEHGTLEKGDEIRINTLPMPVLVDVMRAQLSAKQIKKESSVVTVGATTDCIPKATAMVTKMIEFYNNDAILDKNMMAANTREFVQDRLIIVKHELDSIERVVELYKQRNQITSIEEEAALFLQGSTEYQKKMVEIETQISLMNYIKAFVFDEENAHSLIPANLGVSDPALVTLMESYNELELRRMRIQRTATAENPMLEQIDKELATIRGNIVKSINSIGAGLQIMKEQAEAEELRFSKRIANVPQQEREYIDIRRQQEIKQKIYIYLQQKLEENSIALASTIMPAKIIDKAQATPAPVAPRRNVILFFALCMGCAIPVGCIFLYGLWDNTIADDKEYEKLIRAPFLGKLVQSRQNKHIVVTANENSPSAELFRLLRTNLRFMLSPEKRCHTLLITSSVAGEGKTFVAVNLATSLALLNQRVCVIGLDLRKPMIASYLNLPNKGCLTSYLVDSEYTIEDIIQPSGVLDGFDVIPAGVIPPNPNELLQGDRLKKLLAELREQYDYILIDSAPAGLVSDTYLLSQLADMTLYISRANHSSREVAELINNIYEQKRLPNLVCVLNGVKSSDGKYGYGYANYR